MITVHDIRAKLAKDEATVGTWLQLPSADVAELMARAGPQRTVFSIAVQTNVLLPVHYPEIAEQIAAVEPAKLDVSPVDNFKWVACLIFADTKIRHAYRLWHHKIFLSLETRQAGFLLKNQPL